MGQALVPHSRHRQDSVNLFNIKRTRDGVWILGLMGYRVIKSADGPIWIRLTALCLYCETCLRSLYELVLSLIRRVNGNLMVFDDAPYPWVRSPCQYSRRIRQYVAVGGSLAPVNFLDNLSSSFCTAKSMLSACKRGFTHFGTPFAGL